MPRIAINPAMGALAAALAALVSLSGCGRDDPGPSGVIAQTPATQAVPATPTAEAAPEAVITAAPDELADNPFAGEPDDTFYDACLLASFPSGGLILMQGTRTGDFVEILSEGYRSTWFEEGPGLYVFRGSRQDNLTNRSKSVAVRLRQTNTPPVEGGGCGPRAVVVEDIAGNDRQASPIQTYALVKQFAARARRARNTGKLPITPYHKAASTADDMPYTEQIVTELEATYGGIKSEVGQGR